MVEEKRPLLNQGIYEREDLRINVLFAAPFCHSERKVAA